MPKMTVPAIKAGSHPGPWSSRLTEALDEDSDVTAAAESRIATSPSDELFVTSPLGSSGELSGCSVTDFDLLRLRILF